MLTLGKWNTVSMFTLEEAWQRVQEERKRHPNKSLSDPTHNGNWLNLFCRFLFTTSYDVEELKVSLSCRVLDDPDEIQIIHLNLVTWKIEEKSFTHYGGGYHVGTFNTYTDVLQTLAGTFSLSQEEEH